MNEKLKRFMGIVEEEGTDYDDFDGAGFDEVEEKPARPSLFQRREPVEEVNKVVKEVSRKRIVLVEPETFDEVPEISDQLRNGYTVVVNFERADSEEIKKSFYFFSGVVYTLNGSIQKIARNVFVLAPSNIDIVSDNENNLYSKDVANWELDD